MLTGIQISSLRPYLQTEADMRTTVERVSKIGYRYTQLQWLSMDIPVSAVADALSQNGMVALGTQEKFDPCAEAFDYYIRMNQACHSSDICMSGIPARFDGEDGMKAYISLMQGYIRRAADVGMSLSFHAIENDFRLISNTPAIDILIDALPDLRLVPDTNHLLRVHIDAPSWIKAHAGRIDMIHFKDMVAPVGGAKLMPVGQGCTDFPPIVKACQEAGVQYVLAEQEAWDKDAFDCMKESIEYIESLL